MEKCTNTSCVLDEHFNIARKSEPSFRPTKCHNSSSYTLQEELESISFANLQKWFWTGGTKLCRKAFQCGLKWTPCWSTKHAGKVWSTESPRITTDAHRYQYFGFTSECTSFWNSLWTPTFTFCWKPPRSDAAVRIHHPKHVVLSLSVHTDTTISFHALHPVSMTN